MDEKTKKYLLYGGIALAVLLVLFLFRRGSGSSGTTLYTTGISSSDAAAISVAGINAAAQEQEASYATQLGIAQASDELAYGKSTNASNLAIAKSTNSTYQNIEDTLSLNELKAILSTNNTNQNIAYNTNKTEAGIVANEGSTEVALQPSWLDKFIGLTSFSNQFGGNSYTGGSSAPFTALVQALAQVFGGGGGAAGGLGSMFSTGGAGSGAGSGAAAGIGAIAV